MLDKPDDNVENSESTAQTAAEPTDYDTKARDIGWVDKDQYRGDPAKWVDAETFYEKGQHVLPIVKSQLRESKERTARLEKEVAQARLDTVKVKELIEKANAREKAELKTEIALLRQQKATAIQDGDGDRVNALEDKIDELKEAAKDAEKKSTPEVVRPADFEAPQVFIDWQKENVWYGAKGAMTSWANGRGAELDLGGKSMAEAFAIISTEAREKFPEEFPVRASERQSAQRGGSSQGSAKAGTFNSMPDDVQKECIRMEKQYGIKRDQYVKEYHGA